MILTAWDVCQRYDLPVVCCIDMGAYQTKLGMCDASLLNIDDTSVTDQRNTEGTATLTSP